MSQGALPGALDMLLPAAVHPCTHSPCEHFTAASWVAIELACRAASGGGVRVVGGQVEVDGLVDGLNALLLLPVLAPILRMRVHRVCV